MGPTQLRVLSLDSAFVYCVKIRKSDKRVKWPSFPRITVAFHVVLIAAANRPLANPLPVFFFFFPFVRVILIKPQR